MTRSRLTILAILPLLAVSLVACATVRETSRYQQELGAYTAECRERGGILQPIPGAATGQARADYACIIRGGATRLN